MGIVVHSCINGATTMPYSLAEDVRAAADAGFEAVEIWQRKLTEYLAEHSVADLRRLLRDHSLAVAAICPLTIAFGDEAETARRQVAWAAEVAAEIECATLLVCLRQPDARLSPEQALDVAALEAARTADVAAAHNVNLAIEPLGRHPLVPGPSEALAIVERAGRKNVGIMLDTFHYYKSDVPLSEIANLPIDRLMIVHVNDCEDRPRAELRDAHRLYPTLGVIPAAPMLRPLLARGYRGHLSVEIFREEYWQRPIDEISRQARLYLDRLVEQIGSA
jgi:2-keto-myo-inositol isomerase